jgi:hypothetical protein
MQVTTIGLDIAKNVFQVHGIDASEKVVVRKRLRRSQVLAFFEALPPCLVGMEDRSRAFGWDRSADHIRASGQSGRIARRQASKRKQAVYMAAPERFAKKSDFSLAPRAPSIHGPSGTVVRRLRRPLLRVKRTCYAQLEVYCF